MITPYTPADARNAERMSARDAVVSVVNGLLAHGLKSKSSVMVQEHDVYTALYELGYSYEEIRADRAMEFADRYQEAGWDVAAFISCFGINAGAGWMFLPSAS